MSNIEDQIRELETAISSLKAQQAALGEVTVKVALGPMREKLIALRARLSPQPELTGERKLVTILFADISGFTAMAETMDPETVRDVVNSCFERLVPIVEKYGGSVDKFIGDEIMALFGAPVAHENDAERALRTALEMKDTMIRFNADLGTNLGLHFGINTGLVIAGAIGTQGRQDYSVMGDAVNLAARLESASECGEIFVGPDTYRLTASLFEFEALAPIPLKGKSEPVTIYRVLNSKVKPDRKRELEIRGISSPLVGRDVEVAAITYCIGQLLKGQGGIVSLIGEAGVGKSRLMAEISRKFSGEKIRWLEGRTLSFGQKISYWPFLEILWQHMGISEDDSEAEAWRKLEATVDELFADDTAQILPYLASLLTLKVKDEYAERVKYLDSEAMGHQIFLATRRFFERLAQSQPLVLVFEDLHWVDESSVKLMKHLLPLVNELPILVIGVSRLDPEAQAIRLLNTAVEHYAHCYTGIRLTRLSKTDSAHLLHNLLAIDEFSTRVRKLIVTKAEGNPFYIEEIIRTLIDTGAVVCHPTTGRWIATAQLESVTIPDTIQGVIMARVDRLDEDLKRVLRTAAVIGRSFLYRVLKNVMATDLDLAEHLARLQKIEIIRERQQLPELEYIFKHGLAQEATYESILLKRRREIHAQVGQAIERLFPDRLEEFYGVLAYHFAQAEAWDKAQNYLLKAGDQAGQIAADAEALTHYQRALTACGRAFGDKWDAVQRASLERKMGEALYRSGEHAQALFYLQRALNYLGRSLPTSRWGVRLATLREIIEQTGHLLLPAFFVRPSGKTATLAIEEEARIYEAVGWIDMFTNLERFLLTSIRSLNFAERNGFTYGIAEASTGLGIIIDFIPIFWLAEYYHQRAISVAERVQHPGALGLAYHGLAFHESLQGRWKASLEHDLHAADIYQKAGNLRGWGVTLRVSAFNLMSQGNAATNDFARDLSYSQELIRFGRDGADSMVLCWGLTQQGSVQLMMGDLEAAAVSLEQAVELSDTIPDYHTRLNSGYRLGRCYLRQGKLESALTMLETTRQISLEYAKKRLDLTNSLYNGLAEAYLAAAEQNNGNAIWFRKANHALQASLKWGNAYRPGLPETLRLRGTYEWLQGKPAAAQKWWRRSLSLAQELGQCYDVALTYLETGQRSGDLTHLKQAQNMLTEMNAAWDLERVRVAIKNIATPESEF